jgi:membrane protein YqaA with SNARE-associated domain
MSISLRRKIGYWFLFILGMSINGFQVYKYFTNQLGNLQLELVVFVIGLALNLAPNYLLRLFEKFVLKRKDN